MKNGATIFFDWLFDAVCWGVYFASVVVALGWQGASGGFQYGYFFTNDVINVSSWTFHVTRSLVVDSNGSTLTTGNYSFPYSYTNLIHQRWHISHRQGIWITNYTTLLSSNQYRSYNVGLNNYDSIGIQFATQYTNPSNYYYPIIQASAAYAAQLQVRPFTNYVFIPKDRGVVTYVGANLQDVYTNLLGIYFTNEFSGQSQSGSVSNGCGAYAVTWDWVPFYEIEYADTNRYIWYTNTVIHRRDLYSVTTITGPTNFVQGPDCDGRYSWIFGASSVVSGAEFDTDYFIEPDDLFCYSPQVVDRVLAPYQVPNLGAGDSPSAYNYTWVFPLAQIIEIQRVYP